MKKSTVLRPWRPSRVSGSLGSVRIYWFLVVPKNLQSDLVHNVHGMPEARHLGRDETYHRAAIRYYWPGMFKDITALIRNCQTYQLQAQSRGLMSQRIVQKVCTIEATDVMGPFPRSKKGHEYFLVFQDLFTEWIRLAPLRYADTESIDSFALLYYWHANPVERTNGVLKTRIRSFIEQYHRNWYLQLNEFRFAYNAALHSTNRVSPAFLNLGQEPLPRSNISSRREGEAELPPRDVYVWTTRMARLEHLRKLMSESSAVNKSNSCVAKLAPKISGLFIVVEVILPNIYNLESLGGWLAARYQASLLQKHVEDQEK